MSSIYIFKLNQVFLHTLVYAWDVSISHVRDMIVLGYYDLFTQILDAPIDGVGVVMRRI